MRKRIAWLIALFWISEAALAGRLSLVAVLPDRMLWGPHNPAAGEGLPAATRMDLEHFAVRAVVSARGHILFRNGMPWPEQRHDETTSVWVQTGWRSPRDLKGKPYPTSPSPVVGMVGLPDVWPARDRAAPEQGRSGLEQTFDEWLRSDRPGYIGQLKDATDQLVDGTWYHVAPNPGHDVRTTVDPAWQGVAEAALRHAPNVRTAIVILDVRTNQVLALAGHDPRAKLAVPAIMAAAPGSIFKLVVAATALESYQVTPSTRFYCPGFVSIPGVRMRCWTQHGQESLVEAIAQSCDTAFAELGVRLGGHALSATARRLRIHAPGLQTYRGIPVLPGAASGEIGPAPVDDNGWLANTAIGQEDVRVTPLWAANLAATIARGGIWRDAQLVESVEQDGRTTLRLSPAPAHRAMSAHTAAVLAQAMREAVTWTSGTAHDLARATTPCAIKTGTAELPGTKRVNVWRVGFAPYKHPDIAFAVALENVETAGGHTASREIVHDLLWAYRQFRPSAGID